MIFSLLLYEIHLIMLIRFTVENFLSFKDRQSFSMIPGKGTLKAEHKTDPVKGISTLKTAILFGANASGKSNLIKAIDFGKNLVLDGVKSYKKINFQNFRLDTNSQKSNSRIEFEVQHKGKNYAYGFVFNTNEIVEEWLFEVTKKSDNKIFTRDIKKKEVYDLIPINKKNSKKENQFLNFTALGTPKNNLFLTEIRNRNVQENVSNIEDLWNIIDWFQNSLKVIFPDDKYNEGLKFELRYDENLVKTFEEFLSYFDTGIKGIDLEKIDYQELYLLPETKNRIKEGLQAKKTENQTAIILIDNAAHLFSLKEDKVEVYKFRTKHHVTGQTNWELFDTSDESDGTNRIIDFIPLLMDLLKGDNVFVIDEMERSLHPNLIYDLIDLFLSKSKNINSQLILASHETTLLTQKLLRKDEVWFLVKEVDGSSKLYSLQEYNVRFDKQIRKDYLLGRFKAIPKIGNRNKLTVLPNQS